MKPRKSSSNSYRIYWYLLGITIALVIVVVIFFLLRGSSSSVSDSNDDSPPALPSDDIIGTGSEGAGEFSLAP